MLLRRTAIGVVLALLVVLPATAQDYKRGQFAYNRGDFLNALREWWLLAEQGNARSQYSVGVLLDRGQGVPQNYAEAAMWYRKAAEQGYSSAQYNLGVMYHRGRGVSRDYTKAVEWYRQAAEQGQANAQHNLDFMQKKGRSAPRKAALATVRGDFRVQLGAVRSKARAVKEANRLISLHKRTLGRLTIVPVRADLGSRGVYYRLRVGPFPDRATADSLCRKLSARQQNCIVVEP